MLSISIYNIFHKFVSFFLLQPVVCAVFIFQKYFAIYEPFVVHSFIRFLEMIAQIIPTYLLFDFQLCRHGWVRDPHPTRALLLRNRRTSRHSSILRGRSNSSQGQAKYVNSRFSKGNVNQIIINKKAVNH